MSFRLVLVSLAFTSAIAAVACSSNDEVSQVASGNCPSVGEKACSNDEATDQSSVDQCNAALSGSCGAQYKALLECAGNNHSCDSSGMSQINNNACDSQTAAYAECAVGGDGGTVTVTSDAGTGSITTDAGT